MILKYLPPSLLPAVHVRACFRNLFLVVLAVAPMCRTLAQDFAAPGFVYENVYLGNGMTAMDFDEHGRMYVCEKQGRVLVFEPDGHGDFKPPTVLIDIRNEVNPDGESGLLGIAIDPHFTFNRQLYLFYTAAAEQRLTRFTVGPSFTVAGQEVVLLGGLPRTATNHKAGDIHFHPGDPKNIFLTLGDDAHKEFAPDLDHYNGKLLRVDAASGKGLPDNPFYDGNPDSVRSRVWAYGLRNPFRFTFDPKSLKPDVIYISENGDGTDRIAQIRRGSNCGWGPDGDKGLINPPDPTVRILQTSKPCLTAIAIASSGPFAMNGGSVLYYENWFGPELRRGQLTGMQRDTYQAVATDKGAPFAKELKCVNLKFGPDGALYTTQTYYAESVANNFKIGRIRFTGK